MRFAQITFLLITILVTSIAAQNNLDIDYQTCNGCPQAIGNNPSINAALYGYGASQSYQVRDIESDFDLRRAQGNTRWHKGLDLRNHGAGADQQRGDALIATEAGTITQLSGTGYKYVVIDGATNDFGYGHIFSHNNVNNTTTWRSGDFVLKMSNPNVVGDRFVSIINLNTCIAYSREPNRTVIIANNPHCTDTLTTTNQVAAGAAFAPIGGSRNNATQDFPVHLHLYKFLDPGNAISNEICLDPLVDLEHPNSNFDLRITLNQNIEPTNFSNWGNCVLNYPGTTSNSIAIRAIMNGAQQGFDASRYTNYAHNLDSLQIFLKREHADTNEVIIGPTYKSEFLLHAKPGTPLYPTNIIDHYGSQAITGISPRAYQDGVGFRPYDNFYFADFTTRVHVDDDMSVTNALTKIADNPEHARYNDGKYDLFIKSIDVKSDSAFSDTCSFTLDNFKPYIQSVQVDYDDEITYESEWNSTDPSLTTAGDGYITQGAALENAVDQVQPPFTTPGLVFTISSSEPLAALSMFIEDANFPGVDFGDYPGGATDDTRMEWEFIVPYDSLPYEHCFKLIFNGNDCSDNELLNLTRGANNTIPTRQSATTWSAGAPDGNDEVHKFCLESCTNRALSSRVDCLNAEDIIVEVLPASSSTTNNGSIEIQIPSGADTLTVTWTEMSSGLEVGDGSNLLANRLPGIYCWEFKDPECCRIWSNCHEVRNCADNTQMTLEAEPNCDLLIINLSASGGMDPYTFAWRFGLDVGSPVIGTDQNFIAPVPGEYCVEVTDACGQTTTLCQEVGINIESFTSPRIIDYCQGRGGYGSISLLITGTSLTGYTYQWNTGETTSRIYGLVPGQYCVTISNTSNCSSTNCYLIEEDTSIDYVAGGTCYGASTGGITLLGIYSGANVIWDNGMQGLILDNLPQGTYCYQWENQSCGVLSDCIEIEYLCCSEIIMHPNVVVPTGCDNDGSIGFGPGGAGIDGVNYPLDYLWSTGDTTTIIDNLGAGIFSLTITDAIGCTAIESWDLSFMGFITFEVTSDACEGVANGVAVVIVTNNGDIGNSDGNFNFVWSNGFTTNGGTESYQEDLLPGTYTVTVTDIEAQIPCTHITSLVVGELPMEGSFEVEGFVTPTCPDQTNGRIDLQISGGNGPYTIIWSNGSWQSNNFSLSAGTYTVTVTDICSRALISQYTVPGLEMPSIGLVNSSGCEGEGTAQFQVSYSGSYEIDWEHNGQTDLNLTGLSSGTFCANVMADNGCSVRTCFDLGFGGGTLNFGTTESCEGFGNGSLDVDIYISNIGEFVEANLISSAGIQIPIFGGNANSNPLHISQGGLNPGNYTLLIDLDCGAFSETLSIDEVPPVEQFDFYEKGDNRCIYIKSCAGMFIEETEKEGVFDFVNANSSWSRCNTPILCPVDNFTGKNKHFQFKMMRVGFYEILLNAILGNNNSNISGIPDLPQAGPTLDQRANEGLLKIQTKRAAREITNCTVLSYCTADFRITRFWPQIFGGDSPGPVAAGEGNCYGMICDNGLWSNNVTECIGSSDFGLDDNSFDFPILPPPSEIRMAQISELILLHQNGELMANIPNYFFSDLRIAIMEYIGRGPDDKYNCAQIRFRVDDGFVISDNYDDIICNISNNVPADRIQGFLPNGYNDCTIYSYSVSAPGYAGYVYCGTPCGWDDFGEVNLYCVESTLISNEWSTLSFNSPSPNNLLTHNAENSKIFLHNPVLGDTLSGIYATFISENESDEGQDFVLDYLAQTRFDHKDNLRLKNVTTNGIADMGIVENSILDGKQYYSDRKAIFTLKDEVAGQFKIRIENEGTKYDIPIFGNNLTILDFQYDQEFASILIGVENTLTVGTQLHSGGNHGYNVFEIKVFDSHSIDVNRIISFNGDQEDILMAEYRKNELYVALKVTNIIEFLDEPIALSERTIVSIINEYSIDDWTLEKEYYFDASIKIHSYLNLTHNIGDIVSISGYGNIEKIDNGNGYYQSLTDGFTILSYDSSLEVFNNLPLGNLEIDNIDFHFTESNGGRIYGGTTISQPFTFEQNSYGGVGDQDMILLETNISLNEIDIRSYGQEDFAFDLKELKADSLALYVGGNIYSPAGIVNIENKSLYVLDNSGTHSFMVYLNFDDDASSEFRGEQVNTNSNVDNESCNVENYFIAGNQIFINDAQNFVALQIFDQLGRIVYESKIVENQNLFNRPNVGVYYLKLVHKNGNICSKKIWIGE